jgi:chromosome segregation ATPase
MNELKDAAIRLIGIALIRNESLAWLDISDTLMGDTGARAVSEGIEQNKTLKHLIMDSNRISDVGGADIGKALLKNRGLVRVSIKSNEMADQSAQALIEALDQNKILTDLSVDFNNFSYRAQVQLNDALAAHKKFLKTHWEDTTNRHIAALKEDEQRLEQARSQTAGQAHELQAGFESIEAKTKLLAAVTESRQREVDEATARLEAVRQRYDEVSELKSHRLIDFNKEKITLEHAHSAAMNQCQMAVVKRQHAQGRLKRAQTKKNEAEVEAHVLLDDLKVHVMTIREQLRQLIQEAREAQKEISQKEAEEKAIEEVVGQKKHKKRPKSVKPAAPAEPEGLSASSSRTELVSGDNPAATIGTAMTTKPLSRRKLETKEKQKARPASTAQRRAASAIRKPPSGVDAPIVTPEFRES